MGATTSRSQQQQQQLETNRLRSKLRSERTKRQMREYALIQREHEEEMEIETREFIREFTQDHIQFER